MDKSLPPAVEPSAPIHKEYTRRVYAAPFGRYEGARPNEYPANEVLIGRERERARMMDWLLAFGRRGAYLVTGYRGVGKTSFVNYCIKQYEDDVYGRYLQSRIGRALFWDRPAITAAVPLALLAALLAAQLAHGLWAASGRQLTPGFLLSGLVLAPLFLIAFNPLYFGLATFVHANTRRRATTARNTTGNLRGVSAGVTRNITLNRTWELPPGLRSYSGALTAEQIRDQVMAAASALNL